MNKALLFPLIVASLFGPNGRASHELREIRGFRVQIERELLGTESELGRAVLELLDVKLHGVERAVPPRALAHLRKVPLWISVDDPVTPCACYHPSASWLRQNGHDPRKALGVEIANARRFLEWEASQPAMILHELAHAYHHRVLDYSHPGVLAAHRRALTSGAYDEVLSNSGEYVRAYALRDPQEFFAECSEAFFGTNDYYPFVKAELRELDPETHELLERVWSL